MKERPILFSSPMIRAILAGTKTQTRRAVKHNDWYGEADWDAAFVDSAPNRQYLHVPQAGGQYGDSTIQPIYCPYGVPGDHLWVREAWADTNGESGPMISYRAGGDRFLVDESYPVDYSLYPGCLFAMWCGDLRRGAEGHSWRSPIHMPRWASRITLEITEVRVQRVQAISEEDARAEGLMVKIGQGTGAGPGYKWNGPGYTGIDREPSPTFHVARETEAECSCFARPIVAPAVCAYRELWDQINGAKHPWSSDPWVWAVSFKRVSQ